MTTNGICKEHSGCMARIENNEKDIGDQWGKMSDLDKRINTIFTRLNITLGGVVVMAIALAVNSLLKLIAQ